MTTKKKIRIFQVLLLIFFVFFMFWIFDRNFALLGGVTVVQDYKNGDYRLISDFGSYLTSHDGKEYPDGRPIENGSVRFEAYKQKSFTKAKVEIEYENIDQDLIRFGLAGAGQVVEDSQFDEFDLYEYFSHYVKQDMNGQEVYLWQANEPYYSTPDEFLDDFSLDKKVVSHYYTIPSGYAFAANQEFEPKESVFDNTLRGGHDFYLYLLGPDSKISFSFLDRNFYQGGDSISIVLGKGGEEVYHYEIDDDGNQSANREESHLQEVQLDAEIEAGIYSLQIGAGTDIFIEQVKVNPGYLAVKGKMILTDPNESYLGYTNVGRIAIKTKHDVGLQKVRFGENSLEIDKVGRGYEIEAEPYSQIVIPAGDVEIESWGMYADSLEALRLFAPENVVTFTSEEDLAGVDYFLTTYFPIKSNKKVFYFEDLDPGSNKVVFGVELPWLELGEEGIVIKQIRITFDR